MNNSTALWTARKILPVAVRATTHQCFECPWCRALGTSLLACPKTSGGLCNRPGWVGQNFWVLHALEEEGLVSKDVWKEQQGTCQGMPTEWQVTFTIPWCMHNQRWISWLYDRSLCSANIQPMATSYNIPPMAAVCNSYAHMRTTSIYTLLMPFHVITFSASYKRAKPETHSMEWLWPPVYLNPC